MASGDKFKSAGQDIVSEEIDGEVVIVNLGNGHYYSLTQSATKVWEAIQEQATLEDIQNCLIDHYTGDPEIIRKSCEELVLLLENESLISRLHSTDKSSEPIRTTPGATTDRQKEVFQPPIFELFTDMEDLLLLDPVHETEDEKGWPHAKTEN